MTTFYRLIAIAIFAVLYVIPASSTNEKMQIFDEELLPRLNAIQGAPSVEDTHDLKALVDTIHAIGKRDNTIESLDPRWISTRLREIKMNAAALSLCGAELESCDAAKERLRTLTAQCSYVFLGIVDVDEYPETPRNLYDTPDPSLILLMPIPGENRLDRVGIFAVTNANTVATVLCPEDSNAFGPALRALRGFGQ